MKKFFIIILILCLTAALSFTGCAVKTAGTVQETKAQSVETTQKVSTQEATTTAEESTGSAEEGNPTIKSITPEEVFEILSAGEDYILLDVRTQEEYNEGHIEGAMLITVGELEFEEVYDMGGISDWQAQGYPVVVGE